MRTDHRADGGRNSVGDSGIAPAPRSVAHDGAIGPGVRPDTSPLGVDRGSSAAVLSIVGLGFVGLGVHH